MAKIPYFPFYPDDWIASRKRLSLTYKQQGIYILLLAHSWSKPLPQDKEVLLKLVPRSRWSDIEKVLLTCFSATCDGHANDKLATLKRHATDISMKASYAGKCSSNKRLYSTSVEQPLNERSTNQNQNQNQNQKEHKSLAGKSPPDPRINEVKNYFIEACFKVLRFEPVFEHAKDGKLIKSRLNGDNFTLDELKDLIDWFVKSDKSKEHMTLAAALSAHSMNLWGRGGK